MPQPPTRKVVPQSLGQRGSQLLCCPQQWPLLAGFAELAKLLVLAGPLQSEQQHQQLLQLRRNRLAGSRKALEGSTVLSSTGGSCTTLAAHSKRRRPVSGRQALLDGPAEQRPEALLHRIHSRQQAGCLLLQPLDRHLALLCGWAG